MATKKKSPVKNYNIRIVRIGYSETEIEVEATSLDEAIEIAYKEAPSIGFPNEFDSDYKIDEEEAFEIIDEDKPTTK